MIIQVINHNSNKISNFTPDEFLKEFGLNSSLDSAIDYFNMSEDYRSAKKIG